MISDQCRANDTCTEICFDDVGNPTSGHSRLNAAACSVEPRAETILLTLQVGLARI